MCIQWRQRAAATTKSSVHAVAALKTQEPAVLSAARTLHRIRLNNILNTCRPVINPLEKSKRISIFPISRIPSSRFPINNGDNLILPLSA